MKKDSFVWWNLWRANNRPVFAEIQVVADGTNCEQLGWTLLKYHVASSRYVGKPLIDEDGNLVTSFKHTIILSSDEIDALIVAKLLKQ